MVVVVMMRPPVAVGGRAMENVVSVVVGRRDFGDGMRVNAVSMGVSVLLRTDVAMHLPLVYVDFVCLLARLLRREVAVEAEVDDADGDDGC